MINRCGVFPEEKQIQLFVGCIVFGYYRGELFLLLGNENDGTEWNFVTGEIRVDETCEQAVSRLLTERTCLAVGTYVEQFKAVSYPLSGRNDRSLVITYFTLVDVSNNFVPLNTHTRWFAWSSLPSMCTEQHQTIEEAKAELAKRLTCVPISQKLLPAIFTLRTLHSIYQIFCDTQLDISNFKKRFLGLRLLRQLRAKSISGGRKPAFLFSFQRSATRKQKHNRGLVVIKTHESATVRSII